ncbi:ABC transporter ATP-binding protein [Ferrimonas balearica]|uniref:ABC transporter ATP-binding protein n=1 Tax=Ferrimonas balearica TaxID=44012 RepID=UPI001C9931F6|nr:ABC transporter ATP-binding protein [Ferrimonas balearica]MBY5991625.1 ABC transporter ATP-binding protein [Ferrimonas balearica]
MIQVNALHFSRLDGAKPRPILSDLQLTLAPGEQCSLVGDSGTGKTTLLNLLAGLEPLQSGEVTVGGQSLSGQNATALAHFRRQIGIVFQSFQLLESLSIRDNILLPFRLNGGRGQPDRLASLCDALGLTPLLDRYPMQLSGGEQQRVAVCRALVHRPRVILADEPTGNLDEGNSQRVVSALQTLAREQDTTLLMVTHSQALARQFDRQLRLHDGQLHEVSAP